MKQLQKLPLNKIYNMLPSEMRQNKNIIAFRRSMGVVLGVDARLFRLLGIASCPYLLENYRMGLIVRGHLHGIINLREYTMHEGMIVFVTPGTIVEPLEVSDDFQLFGMGLSAEKFCMAHREKFPQLFNGQTSDGRIAIAEEKQEMLKKMMQLLHDLIEEDETEPDVVYSMVTTITHYFDLQFRNNEEKPLNSHSNELFNRFLRLVNLYGKREHQLGFYADRLCITSRYLGTVVQATSGIKAKEWIDRAIISSAKVMLKHSDKQTTQIADELHFPNASFFCKYFKRATGLTPQQYRGEN